MFKVGDLVRYKEEILKRTVRLDLDGSPALVIGFEEDFMRRPPRVKILRSDGVFLGHQEQYEVISSV